ncbi:MAG: class I SAM-dependent methyltransferase [Bacteroidetes bacterium]|nr:class I SAM-dependent methyltransferase [Bacteroidota bacterium]
MMNKKELKDIINWDVETWKEILPYWEKQLLNYDKATSLCIEIGARDGGITLWMALNGFKMTCSDNYYDLEDAKKLHSEYNIIERIEYKQIDLLNWKEDEKYDVIVLKSVFGALQNEISIRSAVDNIFGNLKKGGILLFAENSKGAFFHQKLRKKYTDWGNIWFYFDDELIKRLFDKFGVVEVRYNGVLTVFGNRVGLSTIFSKLDKYFFNKITPNRVKYMLFGYAKK